MKPDLGVDLFHIGVTPWGPVQIARKCPTLLVPDLAVINTEMFT